MAGTRLDKINNLIKREMMLIFQQNARTLFGGAMITVTQVKTSPDLGSARIYVSIFAAPDKEKCLKEIKEHGHQLRGILGKTIGKQMRKVPELFYYLDDSLDYYETIDNLLKN